MTTHELLMRAGPDAWRAFLEHWGPQPRQPRRTPEPAIPVADLLREFHAAVGKVAINQLVPLDELEVEDGRILIYREEQGVFQWALRADEAAGRDPVVWGSYGEAGDTWTVQAPSLSLFLTELLVLDAAVGGLGGNGFGTHSQIRRPEAERVLAPLGELPWSPWSWPPDHARFLAGDGVVAFVTCERANDEDWCSAFVGGRDAGALAPFRALATSDDWDWRGEG